MALRVVSPELVLVDPTLLGEAGGAPTPEEQMTDETLHVNGSNGASATPAAETADPAAAPSVETILFKAGLITADQLGEVVLERVQSGRPAGDIVVERGLVSRETLAEALAVPSTPVSEPAPAPEPLHAAPAAVAEPVAAAPPAPVVEPPLPTPPVEQVAPPVEPVAPPLEAQPVPEPVAAAPAVAEPVMAEPVVAEPVVAEPVMAEPVIAEPAVAEPVAVAPVAPPVETPPQPAVVPTPEPAPAAAAAAAAEEDRGLSMGEVHYGIRIRLAEGVTLEAGSYASREGAIEAARAIAAQLATEGSEWPLVGDTLVRPDAVLAIEIESAVSWFSRTS